MFYYLDCYKCKKSIKVSIKNYRTKKEFIAKHVLKERSIKLKKLNIFYFRKLNPYLRYQFLICLILFFGEGWYLKIEEY